MAFIESVGEAEARGAVAELYESERQRVGQLPNMARPFSHRPAAYRARAVVCGFNLPFDLSRLARHTGAARASRRRANGAGSASASYRGGFSPCRPYSCMETAH